MYLHRTFYPYPHRVYVSLQREGQEERILNFTGNFLFLPLQVYYDIVFKNSQLRSLTFFFANKRVLRQFAFRTTRACREWEIKQNRGHMVLGRVREKWTSTWFRALSAMIHSSMPKAVLKQSPRPSFWGHSPPISSNQQQLLHYREFGCIDAIGDDPHTWKFHLAYNVLGGDCSHTTPFIRFLLRRTSHWHLRIPC